MDFSDRLRETIKRTGLKRDDFAEKTGKSRGQLFKYLGGESAPTADFFQAVKDAFPWVNIEWLITGHGDMIISVASDGRADYTRAGPPVDDITEKILKMLRGMPEEKRRDVLKYAEERKQLAELLAASGGARKKAGGDSAG